jgi:hypothetical protein
MLIVSINQVCGVSGRSYREFQGERYWLWANRGIYGSQVGGKTRLLHLEVYRAIHGEPPIRAKVECVDGNMCNTDPGNWIIKRSVRERVHPVQEIDGVRFYFKPEGYYKADHGKYGGITMHRYVWQKHNGDIPAGMHVHHIDGDKSNNRIENLEMLTASDHSKHHGSTNKWVGSEANKRQILAAGELAKTWHSSPAGLAWHSENGKKAWESRTKTTKQCVECGKEYETYYPTRSKFCHQNCKATALRRRRSDKTSL